MPSVCSGTWKEIAESEKTEHEQNILYSGSMNASYKLIDPNKLTWFRDPQA